MSDIKKTTPNHENSPSQNNNTVLRFAEFETLRLLLESPLNRFELGYQIMSGYAPNEVKAIRDILGYDAIETERAPYLRRDGKTTHIGIYHLHDMKRATELFKDCQT